MTASVSRPEAGVARLRAALARLRPAFWDQRATEGGAFRSLFNFRRVWRMTVLLTACVAIVPLVLLTAFDLNVTRHSAESEIAFRISKRVSNTAATVAFFLEERRYAVDFIVRSQPIERLRDRRHLVFLLARLQETVGGITDLGLIDPAGNQLRYAGPYDLEGRNYRDEPWFREVLDKGAHISDVFLGFREVPHLVIAVRRDLPDGSFYVFRATLDTERFARLLSQLERGAEGDLFLINRAGVIQTPSARYGPVLAPAPLPVPAYAAEARVYEQRDAAGRRLVVGYAYIADSPFVLVNIVDKDEVMRPWNRTRLLLLLFVAVSITLIVVVIVAVATRLVNEVYLADQRRIVTLHEAEHSAKLASIGRLAAGVAHEINNPLAIIGEKAGLLKDLLTFQDVAATRDKLIGLADAIQASVDRCGAITKRLLGFARRLDVRVEPVDVRAVIEDILAFFGKEASDRSIEVTVDIPAPLARVETDRGRLQQIFLNIINNAFAAMSEGGHLRITAHMPDAGHVAVQIRDDGCGIPRADLERIFEPFFTTRKDSGGTGLGLAITHSLVQEIGGRIEVESELGEGSSFTVTLPLQRGRA